MTVDEAIAKLEGKKPVKRPPVKPEMASSSVILDDLMPVKAENKGLKTFIKISLLILIVSILILYHLWRVSTVVEDSYKKGYMDGIQARSHNMGAPLPPVVAS